MLINLLAPTQARTFLAAIRVYKLQELLANV